MGAHIAAGCRDPAAPNRRLLVSTRIPLRPLRLIFFNAEEAEVRGGTPRISSAPGVVSRRRRSRTAVYPCPSVSNDRRRLNRKIICVER